LEHLEHTAEVLENLRRILRPGGWGFHAIDLRDHTDFSKPLEFLKYDQAEHERRTGCFQNRLRAGEFLDLFEASGYRIAWTEYMTQPLELIEGGDTDVFDMAMRPMGKTWPYRSLEEFEPWIDDALFASFHPSFQKKSSRELSVLGMCVVCQRPE
jgi:hypothetical protein